MRQILKRTRTENKQNVQYDHSVGKEHPQSDVRLAVDEHAFLFTKFVYFMLCLGASPGTFIYGHCYVL